MQRYHNRREAFNAGEKTRQHLFDVVEFGGKASTVFSQKSIHLGLQVVCVTDQILDLLVAMILQPLYEGPMIELLSIAFFLAVITEQTDNCRERGGYCHGVHVRKGPNDPSSATAATRRADCNRDGPPPFAAAHGLGVIFCWVWLQTLSVCSPSIWSFRPQIA